MILKITSDQKKLFNLLMIKQFLRAQQTKKKFLLMVLNLLNGLVPTVTVNSDKCNLVCFGKNCRPKPFFGNRSIMETNQGKNPGLILDQNMIFKQHDK